MCHEEPQWGSCTALQAEKNKKLRISVNPGMLLSQQSRKFLSKHWFIVSESGMFQLDEKYLDFKRGGSVDDLSYAK